MKYFDKKLVPIVFLLVCTINNFAQSFQSGHTYFSNDGFVEYRCGNIPLIISVPHGGTVSPSTIPNLGCSGTYPFSDPNTIELAYAIDTAFYNRYGCRPYIIVNHLLRAKFDANRDLQQATCGETQLQATWHAYQNFIDTAKQSIINNYSTGLFIDLHGHGHVKQRLEIGYNLTASDLQNSDNTLNGTNYLNKSTIKGLVSTNFLSLSHAQLLRGPNSLGAYFENSGYDAVPSSNTSAPGWLDFFFSGGFNTETHGSMNGGSIHGIQIECNFIGLLDSKNNRQKFADTVSLVLPRYISTHILNTNFMNCLPTGITEKYTAQAHYVFPNPTKNTFTIFSEKPLKKWRMVDITGKIMIIQTSGELNTFDISQFQPGIYFMHYTRGDGYSNHLKIIKQ